MKNFNNSIVFLVIEIITEKLNADRKTLAKEKHQNFICVKNTPEEIEMLEIQISQLETAKEILTQINFNN
jgi:hypothetical protein